MFRISSLEVLDVSHNSLTSLPDRYHLPENNDDVWCCHQLTELNVSHNNLTTLPETFQSVPHLQQLNVSSNKLDCLPQSLSEVRFLEYVNLKDNNLTMQSRCNLPNTVKRLELSENKLRCIPEWVTSITNLESLNISSNRILTLPRQSSWQQPHLETLILSKNDLGRNEEQIELPNDFSMSLTVLDLQFNHFKTFPQAALGLKMVTSLDLQGSVHSSYLLLSSN